MTKLIFLFFVLATSAVYADESVLKNTLQKRVPQIGTITQVSKSAVPGLYEVITQDHLFYTDAKGDFLIDGAVYDLKTMRNVTDERSRKLFAVDFNKLPMEQALKQVKGKGERKLAFFTDPNCGFCKKQEKELLQVDNITIYRFMYPLFPGSEEKVNAVWCSENRTKAWNELILNDIVPPAGNCETPTAKVKALGAKLKVNGTPALIFADGTINPGYMPAAELEKALTAAARH